MIQKEYEGRLTAFYGGLHQVLEVNIGVARNLSGEALMIGLAAEVVHVSSVYHLDRHIGSVCQSENPVDDGCGPVLPGHNDFENLPPPSTQRFAYRLTTIKGFPHFSTGSVSSVSPLGRPPG